MRIFGWTIKGWTITRKAVPLPPISTSGGWYPIIREPFTGAWQQNVEVRPDTILQNPAVFRCVSLIAADIGKIPLCLVQVDANGIWTETTSPAFSPVLRRPNRYQLMGQFLEAWIASKLLWGNTYVLKQRDGRGVVVGLDVLNPTQCRPLIAPDGSVYYELPRWELAGLLEDKAGINAAPASEIIHDRFNCWFHPLVGISPLYACGGAAVQGLKMQEASTAFFANGAQPRGVVTVPGAIDETQAERLRALWQSLTGNTRFLSHGMTYQAIAQTAVDSQLTEQQRWSANTIAGVFGVPVSMIDSSQQPPYANSEASLLQYMSQCLQSLMHAIEACLDDGLELPAPYGTEFDIDDLILMDTATKTKAANDAIGAGALAPNEARFKYFALGPVTGGESPMMQMQYESLAAKKDREDAPKPTPKPGDGAIVEDPPADDNTDDDAETDDDDAETPVNG